MFCIFRDHPSIDPDIGAFLGDHIFQIRIFSLGENSLTGVDDTDGGLIADHLVTHLVDDVSLYQRFLVDKQVFGFLQLVFIGGVERVAQLFQCNSKSIAHAVLHEDVVLVFLVPEYVPAVDGFIYHRLVVQDTDSSPTVGYAVFVTGVKALCLRQIGLIQIGNIGNVIVIQFFQQSLLDHTLYHVVGRADNIIGHSACRYFGIHDLIGLELFIHDFDAGLFFKFIQHIGIDVFSPVVDNDLIVRRCAVRAAASGKQRGTHGCQ